MDHSLEFILNHPVLSVALFIFIYLIISFEIKNFTKKYKAISCSDLVTKINGFNIKQPPMGAFYIFPNISELFGKTFKDVTVNDANDLSMLILEKAHVATVPGDAFGYPKCIRISYSASREQIDEAIKRIKDLLS